MFYKRRLMRDLESLGITIASIPGVKETKLSPIELFCLIHQRSVHFQNSNNALRGVVKRQRETIEMLKDDVSAMLERVDRLIDRCNKLEVVNRIISDGTQDIMLEEIE